MGGKGGESITVCRWHSSGCILHINLKKLISEFGRVFEGRKFSKYEKKIW